jgi:tetratricopeptide (TPR) repeat protein
MPKSNNDGLDQFAIQYFDKVLEHDPSDKEACFNRGTCYINLGQYDRAMEDFKRVLELDPTFTMAQVYVSILAKKLPDSVIHEDQHQQAAQSWVPNAELVERAKQMAGNRPTPTSPNLGLKIVKLLREARLFVFRHSKKS